MYVCMYVYMYKCAYNSFIIMYFIYHIVLVLQEDKLCGTLTIRENVAMSGALRLPRDISASERQERVDELLNDLGLSAVADSLVRKNLYYFIAEKGTTMYCQLFQNIKFVCFIYII